MMPLFTIVMATRDRPVLFSDALTSVLAQEFQDIQIIVVDDGTSDIHRSAYDNVIADAKSTAGNRLEFYSLIHRPRGHGQSYPLNFGVSRARGKYVCFLDDDDAWTDPHHLARAAKAIHAHSIGQAVDLFMANQVDFFRGVQQLAPVWLDGLDRKLHARGEKPDAEGCFEISVTDLMQMEGFCHLNCLIVRRELFDQIGGMDEGIRWGCDHDLFFRLVDRASLILHDPTVVSRHNIPDPAKTNNMTTAISMIEKRLFQLRIFNKAVLLASHPQIKACGRLYEGYTLKTMARELKAAGRWNDAAYYARVALGAKPTLKWALYTLYCWARSIFAKDERI